MKIAQVAPLAESVPPKLYGGTERVVSWLTEELVALGHDVTLFASGDSVTTACHVPAWPHALRLGPDQDPYASYAALLELLSQLASEFEIVHCHTDWLHIPLLRLLGVPFVTTLHGRLDRPYLAGAMAGLLDTSFVSISNSQRAPLPDLNWRGTVHHGLPPDLLKPCFEPDRYFAFLGRIAPEKGLETAVRMATVAGRPLRIAGKVPREEIAYFRERIEPLLKADGVDFIGEIDDRGKVSFLGQATALLFPIEWPEPFGLVMIEAMACGTPVIAMRRGSVPEIINDGVTGVIVDSEEEAPAAIARVCTLDRHRVRAEFERRFTVRRMATEYVSLYKELVAEQTPVPILPNITRLDTDNSPDLPHVLNSEERRNCTITPADVPKETLG